MNEFTVKNEYKVDDSLTKRKFGEIEIVSITNTNDSVWLNYFPKKYSLDDMMNKLYEDRKGLYVKQGPWDYLIASNITGRKIEFYDEMSGGGSRDDALLSRDNWIFEPWSEVRKTGYEVTMQNVGPAYVKYGGLFTINEEEYKQVAEEDRDTFKFFKNVWNLKVSSHPYNCILMPSPKRDEFIKIAKFYKYLYDTNNLKKKLTEKNVNKYLADIVESTTGLPLRSILIRDDKTTNPCSVPHFQFSWTDNLSKVLYISARYLAVDVLYKAGIRSFNYFYRYKNNEELLYSYKLSSPTTARLEIDRSERLNQIREEIKKENNKKKSFFQVIFGR